MSPPPAKRPKLDSAAALRKPFRSPLPRNAQSATGAYSPRPKESTHTKASSLQDEDKLVTPPLRNKVDHSISKSSNALSSPSRVILQRSHAQLLATLTAKRAALDTAAQALKLIRTNRDAELEQLIQMWQAASQAAAEELFASAKDRVNGMGGLRAWQGRELEWAKDGRGWVDEVSGGRCEESGENGFDCQERQERSDEGDSGAVAKAGEEQDEAFTMDMMLDSLNIQLATIGYDKTAQRWVE